MRRLYIFDIDGTLANIEHRLHFIKKDPPDWDAFHDACVDDEPIGPVIETLLGLRLSGAEIWFFSGRSDRVRNQTMLWLRAHVFPEIQEYHLVMRPDGDYTPDDKLKRRFYDNMLKNDRERLVGVFDDRDRVVAMWRSIPVLCFQCQPGDF